MKRTYKRFVVLSITLLGLGGFATTGHAGPDVATIKQGAKETFETARGATKEAVVATKEFANKGAEKLKEVVRKTAVTSKEAAGKTKEAVVETKDKIKEQVRSATR